jgi:hypothetical protein
MMDPAEHVAIRPQPCGDRWQCCARGPWACNFFLYSNPLDPEPALSRRFHPDWDGLGVWEPREG